MPVIWDVFAAREADQVVAAKAEVFQQFGGLAENCPAVRDLVAVVGNWAAAAGFLTCFSHFGPAAIASCSRSRASRRGAFCGAEVAAGTAQLGNHLMRNPAAKLADLADRRDRSAS